MNLQDLIDCGILNSEGFNVTDLEEMVTKMKKSTQLEERVLKAHITEKGEKRTIKYENGLYRTILPNKQRLTAKTLVGLYEKLYEFYGLDTEEYSVDEIIK